jgi:hypothetical protein
MKESIFAAWHPVEGFGPTNEIALRDHYDHAMTDVNLLRHTGDKRWRVVEVTMTVCRCERCEGRGYLVADAEWEPYAVQCPTCSVSQAQNESGQPP